MGKEKNRRRSCLCRLNIKMVTPLWNLSGTTGFFMTFCAARILLRFVVRFCGLTAASRYSSGILRPELLDFAVPVSDSHSIFMGNIVKWRQLHISDYLATCADPRYCKWVPQLGAGRTICIQLADRSITHTPS